jgi:hypothetical protein
LDRVVRGTKKKVETFYKNIYVIGNCIKLRRIPGGYTVIVGAPVHEILDAEAGEEVESIEVPTHFNPPPFNSQ